MALKSFFPTKDAIPEALRGEYEGDDEKGWTLQLDDGDFKAKISEFRGNNIKLSQAREKADADLAKLRSQFEGIDPEQYRKAQEIISKLESDEEKALLASGDFEEVFKRRTALMSADHEKQVTAFGTKIDGLTSEKVKSQARLSSLLIDRDLQLALSASGAKVRAGALDDILARARGTWKLNEDADMQPLDSDGTVIRGKDPANPLTMEEYASGLVETAPHLFEGSKGGGGGGGQAVEGGGTRLTSDDPLDFGDNVEKIASGEMKAD